MTELQTTSTEPAGRALRILLRLDANHQIGLGHAVRTSEILGLLPSCYDLVVAGDGPQLRKFFPQAKIIPVGEEDVAQVRDIASRFGAELFLCDHPRAPTVLWDAVRYRPDLPCVAIDDKGGRIKADLIINGTVLAKLQRYKGVPDGGQVLTGPAYTLIRPAFAENPWRPSTDRRAVTIVVGSGHRAAEWALFLAAGEVDTGDWGDATMIVGVPFRILMNCALGAARRASDCAKA